MIREFSNLFTVQLKKLFLGSVLVVMAVVLGACSDDDKSGGTSPKPPVYSPNFDLGTTFTIASLDKNFTQAEDNISKYSIENVSSADTSKELIETQLKANIKTKLEKNITGTAVTFGDVGITGNAVAEDTLTVTVATTITETATAINTATNIYTFTIKFNNTLKKWDGTATAITEIDGVYEIYNGSHLAWIALSKTLTDNNDFAGKTVRFMNSVDMDNITGAKAFTGIRAFAGRLEGNHKTIYGLNIDKTSEVRVGLIGQLFNGGYIDNLTIAKGGSIKGNAQVGAFVGEVALGATVTIKGVTNHATVEGNTKYVGGLVGESNGITLTIDNSSNKGTVKGNGEYVGGLVGVSASGTTLTISNSSNIGNITGTGTYVGGLVGSSDGTTSTISNSSNIGNVTGTTAVGGLVGDSSSATATITNSHSYAKIVTATDEALKGFAGGIVGRISSGKTLTANNVYWLHDGTDGIAGANGTSGGSNNGTFTNTDEKSKALTIAQFADKNATATNFNGWDFSTVWEILANGLYPTLKPVATP